MERVTVARPERALRRGRRRRRARRGRARCSPGAGAVAVGQPARRRRLARARAHRRAAARRRRHRRVPDRRRRGRQVARHRRRPVLAARARGACCAATRSSRSAAAWSATPPASPPPSTTAASPSCRRRPRCSRRSTPRSAARPRSTCPRARTSSARSTSRSACSPTSRTLATLPPREYRAGLGEVAKYALMPGRRRGRRDRRATHAAAIVARDPDVLTALVAACAAIKARVVAADPQERTGLRATLNYGHTLAHALETGRRLRAAARRGGRGRPRVRRRARRRAGADRRRTPSTAHRDVVDALDLPDRGARRRRPRPTLLASMRRDKKAIGGLTFVLPGADSGSRPSHDPTRARARRRVRARSVVGS